MNSHRIGLVLIIHLFLLSHTLITHCYCCCECYISLHLVFSCVLSSSFDDLTAPVGGGASHSLDTSSGFPGAFHRSSFASFSERLAGSSSQQQRVNENRKRDMQCHSNRKQQPEAAVGSETLPESEDISNLNNRRISAMSAR